MQKIRIRLPATITNLGPSLGGLALALSLYTTIEISPRDDEQLTVDPQGEGAGRYSTGLRHPVVLALARVFQRLERAPLGIDIRVDNAIPVASGLGAEPAFLVAGVIAANNLMGNPYTRDQAVEIAAQISRADSAVGAVFGGLTVSFLHEDVLVYRSLKLTTGDAPMKLVVALPELEQYARVTLGDRAPANAILNNLNRLPLFVEALRTADYDLIGRTLRDSLYLPRIAAQIPAFLEVEQAARDTGAVGVAVAGEGPALLAFAPRNHALIADAMQAAFAHAGVTARAWVLPIDTQGVTLSVLRST